MVLIIQLTQTPAPKTTQIPSKTKHMKNLGIGTFLLALISFTSCGDMSNNTNEDNTHYTDSSGMNPDNAGNPHASDAPMRNEYVTDSTTSTSGPDNAAPKSSATDSSVSTQPRR
jgi:hypothetical protein